MDRAGMIASYWSRGGAYIRFLHNSRNDISGYKANTCMNPYDNKIIMIMIIITMS